MGFWLNLILILIRYGPEIFKLIKEIIDLIKQLGGGDGVQQVARIEYECILKHRFRRYKKTRDTEPLVRLRDELRERVGK